MALRGVAGGAPLELLVRAAEVGLALHAPRKLRHALQSGRSPATPRMQQSLTCCWRGTRAPLLGRAWRRPSTWGCARSREPVFASRRSAGAGEPTKRDGCARRPRRACAHPPEGGAVHRARAAHMRRVPRCNASAGRPRNCTAKHAHEGAQRARRLVRGAPEAACDTCRAKQANACAASQPRTAARRARRSVGRPSRFAGAAVQRLRTATALAPGAAPAAPHAYCHEVRPCLLCEEKRRCIAPRRPVVMFCDV